MSKITIEIEDDQITARESNGIAEDIKYLEYKDLEDLFAKEYVETGILPAGCKYLSKKKGLTNIIIESPAQIREVLYFDRSEKVILKFKVPTPYTYMFLQIRAKAVIKSLLCVGKGPINSMNDKVFKFPFGNVYDDLKICWGKNDLPSVETNQVGGFISMFYNAPFNDDLSNSAFNSFSNVETFYQLLKNLDTKIQFPYQILKDSSMKTVGGILKTLN